MRKLQKVEYELQTSSEQNKEACIATLYSELQEQKEAQIRALQEEHQTSMAILKVEC